MPTVMKWLSVAALLIAVLWRSSLDYRFVVAFVVTVGAIAVVTQAARAERYIWVVVFLVIATLLNPILTGGLPPQVFLWTDVACLVAFAASLVLLKNKPILSMASITDRTPGSESL
jgi:hypothetical protein